jgi:chromosome segregation ATPase
MARETEKKGMIWLKGVISTQNQPESTSDILGDEGKSNDINVYDTFEYESQSIKAESNNNLISKENQDKKAMDVIVSIETILKERQLLFYKNKGLEEQLHIANENITRIKHEQIKKEQIIQEKNKEIRELENNLTNKQMTYDQLLEDYKEYQYTSNAEYERISNLLEIESARYNKLYDESTNIQYQNMLKINELEDKIRNLEIENQKYSEKYNKIIFEKEDLLQTINEFTDRLSFSFSPKKQNNS